MKMSQGIDGSGNAKLKSHCLCCACLGRVQRVNRCCTVL